MALTVTTKTETEMTKPATAKQIDQLTEMDWIRRTLTSRVMYANDVRTALIADLQKSNGDAVYQLRWLQGKDETILAGHIAGMILKEMDKPLIEETDKRWEKEDIRAWLQREIDNWSPESSTSQYSNEMNNVKYKVLKDLKRLIPA